MADQRRPEVVGTPAGTIAQDPEAGTECRSAALRTCSMSEDTDRRVDGLGANGTERRPVAGSSQRSEPAPEPWPLSTVKWFLFAIAGATIWVTLALTAVLLLGPPKTPLGWLLLLLLGPLVYLLEGLPGLFSILRRRRT
jgi:hypothetical protein